METTTTITETAENTIVIEGQLYGAKFNDDPDCPVSIWPIKPYIEELGHKGRSWSGR